MFLLVGLLLFILSLIDIFSKKKVPIIFIILAIVLLFMLCFRYGQGTDYFGYYYLYNQIGSLQDEIFKISMHGEIGWRIIEIVFKSLNVDFPIFIFFISAFTMLITLITINKKSPYRVLSLFLLYPTFYLTYYYSGIRQGIVIALFISLGVELLLKEKTFYYILLTIFLSLIHTSAIILIVLPFIIYKKLNYRSVIFATAFMSAFLFLTGLWRSIYFNIVSGLNYFNFDVSILGILLRTVLFIIIYLMYKKVDVDKIKNDGLYNYTCLLYKIYKFGFIIFIVLSFTSSLSQRLTASLKAVEIILLPLLLLYNNSHKGSLYKNSLLIVTSILLILSIETYKNINAYLTQGNYYDWVKPYNMPVITIFNKDDINKFRLTSYLMELID